MASYDFDQGLSDLLYPQQFEKIGTGVPVPTQKKYFFQRAWNTVGSYYETWVSEGAPDPTPPSGDPVTNLTTSAFWKMVV